MSVDTSIVRVPDGAADEVDVVELVEVDDVELLLELVEMVELVVVVLDVVVVVLGGERAIYAPTPMIAMITITITIPTVREIPFFNDIKGAKNGSEYLRLFRLFLLALRLIEILRLYDFSIDLFND